MIKAVSFDLWDTVIHDKAAKGLRSKNDERRYLAWETLNRHEPISYEKVALAYDVMEAAFNHVWHDQHITWTVRERVQVLLNGLQRTLPDDDLAVVIHHLDRPRARAGTAERPAAHLT
jgi:FMN phosphatase YigB (HAD superfamily)